MSNELLFILMSLASLGFMLIAARMGKIWITGLIAVCAVLMNIFVIKGITLFGMDATGGNVLYASIFLGTDILCEHYGKKEANRAVRLGFFASLFFLLMSQFIMLFTPAEYDIAQGSFELLFTFAPRIIFASMIAYLISQHLDIWIFHKIKKQTGEKMLWLRNNGSTWISQLFDTVIFTVIAFAGIYPLWEMILFTYIIKIIVAAIDTPFLYLSKKS